METSYLHFSRALCCQVAQSADCFNVSLGILSLVQISRIHLFKDYYLGTGLITVVGTSFATLSIADAVCGDFQYESLGLNPRPDF